MKSNSDDFKVVFRELCGNLNYSANNASEIPISKSMSNSFGFGGTNATLVFSELK